MHRLQHQHHRACYDCDVKTGDRQHVHHAGSSVPVAHFRCDFMLVGDEKRLCHRRIIPEYSVDRTRGACSCELEDSWRRDILLENAVSLGAGGRHSDEGATRDHQRNRDRLSAAPDQPVSRHADAHNDSNPRDSTKPCEQSGNKRGVRDCNERQRRL